MMPEASAAFCDLEEKVKRITEASASETIELLCQWQLPPSSLVIGAKKAPVHWGFWALEEHASPPDL